jgi:squalene-hopene/tetraprenyl-beta-curcumene cyclase
MSTASILHSTSFQQTRHRCVEGLLAARESDGRWAGRLSTSALSTATAINALLQVGHPFDRRAIGRGAGWLITTQLPDGSWGDTTDSRGNLSTTLLCWSSLLAVFEQAHENLVSAAAAEEAIAAAAAWIEHRTGSLEPRPIAKSLAETYGRDRTFSVPILTHVALTGRFGDPQDAASWRYVPQLPFELASLPQKWFRRLNLQVVSYALPALIAIGQVRHTIAPKWGPRSWLRDRSADDTLALLETIQPSNGGFLEATPLTSFVTMSLAAMGLGEHAVARRCVAFLRAAQRPDGSWPIDTNLTTWGTSLSVAALSSGGRLSLHLDADARESIRDWLLGQQWKESHPYTAAAPGGWAWTDLPGGVPDADDTSGAIIALAALEKAEGRPASPEVREAAAAGLRWLIDLANRDGGIPTFCRGWGRLPFDTSCPDITAHFLRAVEAWQEIDGSTIPGLPEATRAATKYLSRTQRRDGSWVPLWFGNEHHPLQENPVYGTAKVVAATANPRGSAWLASAVGSDGGTGGGPGLPPSIEETALAVDALSRTLASPDGRRLSGDLTPAVERGLRWLIEATDEGRHFPTAPIGLYFAKLWYSERLYPLVFTAAALEQASEDGDGQDIA